MPRLSDATLCLLPQHIARPNYDRSEIENGIVHLGIGNFHRAHQAVYTDNVLAAGDKRWGILGASLRHDTLKTALLPQDGLYTLGVKSGAGSQWRIIGSVKGVLYAPNNPQDLIETIANPLTRIISLTVTEKAYCLHSASGALDEDHPDIRNDLTHPAAFKSIYGYLLAGIKLRLERHAHLPTLLSCDNLPSNGRKLHAAMIRFAELSDPDLVTRLEDHLRSPSTMVDRIVPQTNETDYFDAFQATGLEDASPVVTEPFMQWVIEDNFSLGRPEWDRFGAEFVGDVVPYERMKLSLLNAAHTALACLGACAGYDTVANAMHDKRVAAFIERFMLEDIAPILALPSNMRVEPYITSLLTRFLNPSLHHTLLQIASDSSQKIPQRLIPTIEKRLRLGLPLGRFAYALAGFLMVLDGQDETGRPLLLRDPKAEALQMRLQNAPRDARAKVRLLLDERRIFSTLGEYETVIDEVTMAYTRMKERGIRQCLA